MYVSNIMLSFFLLKSDFNFLKLIEVNDDDDDDDVVEKN